MGEVAHIMSDGTRVALKDMTDAHLERTIQHIKYMAVRGMTRTYGSVDPASDDVWFDEELVVGLEAAKHMRLDVYLQEQARRKERDK